MRTCLCFTARGDCQSLNYRNRPVTVPSSQLDAMEEELIRLNVVPVYIPAVYNPPSTDFVETVA
jgi:hypothetical protein